jgi:hypothetical protein
MKESSEAVLMSDVQLDKNGHFPEDERNKAVREYHRLNVKCKVRLFHIHFQLFHGIPLSLST